MARELRREARAAAKAGGEDSADEYLKNFDKEIRKEAKGRLKGSNEALVKGIVGGKKEWDRQFKASGMASVDDFVASARKRLQKISDLSGGKGFKLLPQSLADLEAWAEDSKVEATLARQRKATTDQDKAFQSYAKNVLFSSTRMERAIRDQEAAWQSYGRNVQFSMTRQDRVLREQERAWVTYGRNVQFSLDAPKRALAAQEKAFATYQKNITFSMHEAERRVKDQDIAWNTYASNVKHVIDRELEPRWKKFNRGWNNVARKFEIDSKKMGNVMGKVFGKGSRNNFFNFTGEAAEGITRVTVSMSKLPLKAVSGGFKTVVFFGDMAYETMKGIGQLMSGGGAGGLLDVFNQFKTVSGEAMSGFAASLGSLAKTGLPALVAIVAAVTGLAFILPAALALIGNAVGILVALAGTIGIGLIGAALAAAPILAALAGGIGTVALASGELNDKAGKVGKAMAPMRKAWGEMLKAFKDKGVVTIAKALGDLAPLLKTIVLPALNGFADAAGAVMERLSVIFSSKQMKPFIDAWNKALPEIFRKTGTGLADLLGAIFAFFKPIMPFADRLAGLFERLMSRFLDWTTSAEGQNSIKDFMDRAWTAGKKLWDIIYGLGEILGTFFDEGDKGAGSSLFDDMLAKVQQFVDYLKTPEGKNAVADFFSNAKDTAEALGRGISTIAVALGTIDWKEAGETANTILTGISDAIALILLALGYWKFQIDLVGSAFSGIGSVFTSVYNAVIGPVLDMMLGALSGVLRTIAGMLDALSNVPGFEWAKTAADKLRTAADMADRLGDSIRHIPDGNVTIKVGLAGEGARLLRAGSGNKFAQHRTDVLFGAASGGILDSPTFVRRNVIAGEAGREAIVPLDRPLSQVDPSVRALAAVAQGMDRVTRLGAGSVISGGGGSSVLVESGAINVIVPNSDPANVAEAVLDRLAVAALR
jgi:hypothetical protein